MAFYPDQYDRRPRIKHLPGSAGLKREEVLMAPPADTEPESDIVPAIEIKPAEVRRIADSRARARRAGARKDILKRLDDATARVGVKSEIPAGNDIASRRARTRIAAIVKGTLPTSRPLQEVPRASYHSADEFDTSGHVGDFEAGTSLRVREEGDIFDPDGVLSLLAQDGAETVPVMVGGVHEAIEVVSAEAIRDGEMVIAGPMSEDFVPDGIRIRQYQADPFGEPTLENDVDDALEAGRRSMHIARGRLSSQWMDYGLARQDH